MPVDEGEVLIQREIFADGRNACRVNGIPVTVSILRGLGQQLIQIHGQHDSAQLFDEANHLAMLDAFADQFLHGEETRDPFKDFTRGHFKRGVE